MNVNMMNAIKEKYNAEYRMGRQRNFFLTNHWDEDGKNWYRLDKVTKGCSFTVKCTDDEDEMQEFMKDYTLVKIFA